MIFLLRWWSFLLIVYQCGACFLWIYICGRTGHPPASLHQKPVEFVVMRLDWKRVVNCLWRVMNVGSRSAGLVMSTKGVKATNVVLAAILATSVKKVRRTLVTILFMLFKKAALFFTFKSNTWRYRARCLISSIAGCPRVAGDEEEKFDVDDFEDEFQIKNRYDDNPDQNHVTARSVIDI